MPCKGETKENNQSQQFFLRRKLMDPQKVREITKRVNYARQHLRFFLQSKKQKETDSNQRTLTNSVNMKSEVWRSLSAQEDNEGGGELEKQQHVLNVQDDISMARKADNEKEYSCQVCLSVIPNNQDDSPQYRLPCLCQICESCCLEYFKQKVLDGNDAESNIRCPNDSCQFLYKLSDIRYDVNNPDVKLPNFEQIDEYLLRQWQSKTDDCRGCPKCDYFGFVEGNKIVCKEYLECEKCHEKWQDNQQNEKSRFLPKLSELLTSLRKVLSTKQCPACRVHIARNGGCSHMTCKKCTFNFCWYCEGEFAHHSQWKCYLKIAFKYSPMIGLALFGLFSSGFHRTLGKLFLKLVLMIIHFLALNLLLFLIYLSVTFIKDTKSLSLQLEAASLKGNRTSQQERKQYKQNLNLSLFTTGATFLYMSGIFILFKYSILGVIQFAFIEGLVGISGYYVWIYSSFLWSYWMKQVF